MILIAGLGNPGAKYARNRHNVGFMAMDCIMQAHGFAPPRSRFHGELAEGRLGDIRTFILKPMTFMNESGLAVGEFQRFFKIPVENVIVFHDELDLAPGKLRVKTGGGVAGHNGLRSIARHIGPDFRRARLGIGHPGTKARVHGYVLSDFAKADHDWLDPLLDSIARHAPLIAKGDDAGFMNKIALDLPIKKAKPEQN
jgi:PTH1 family peptidyl-tRNA hydrolase